MPQQILMAYPKFPTMSADATSEFHPFAFASMNAIEQGQKNRISKCNGQPWNSRSSKEQI